MGRTLTIAGKGHSIEDLNLIASRQQCSLVCEDSFAIIPLPHRMTIGHSRLYSLANVGGQGHSESV
jgi:hypothetical protein